MLLRMFGRRAGIGFLLGLSLACGGRMEDPPNHDGGGTAGVSGAPAAAMGGSAGSGGRMASAGRAGSGVAGAYTDPGCPNVVPPPARAECDPLDSAGTCPPGEGCYPYVEHPFGRGCDVATFGAICVRSGTGRQGESCGDGTSGCAPGFMCVVGSRSGRRCAQICTFDGREECPAGMLCSDTDVQNYGVCS